MSATEAPEGAKYLMPCPLCGKDNAALDFKLAWRTNTVEPFIHCWTPACAELGGQYIEQVGVELGCGPGASKDDVAEAWVAAADPLLSGGKDAEDEPPERLPGDRTITDWAEYLHASPPAMAYLTGPRGLSQATIRRARLGLGIRWQRTVITVPVYAGGQLVNVRLRFWPKPAQVDGKPVKMLGARGRPMQLYPSVPHSRGVLLLCEGEFDALLARQHGLPAVTSTAGISWNPAWTGLLAGRRVAVVYDAGASSLALAQRRARQFAAGEKGPDEAWAVDLRRVGLTDGEDLTDWFVKYRKSAGDLRQLVRRARNEATP